MEIVGVLASLITISSLVWTVIDQHSSIIALLFFPGAKKSFVSLEVSTDGSSLSSYKLIVIQDEIMGVNSLFESEKREASPFVIGISSDGNVIHYRLLARYQKINERFLHYRRARDSVPARICLYMVRSEISDLRKELWTLKLDLSNQIINTRAL